MSDLLTLPRAGAAPGGSGSGGRATIERARSISARADDLPGRRGRVRPAGVDLGGWLLAAYVCLLPAQVGLADDLRLAPSDLFLLGYLVLRGSRLRWRARDWTGWHAAVLVALAGGALVSELRGTLDLTSLGVKVGGLVVLYVTLLCLLDFLLTIDHLRWLLRLFCGWTAAHTLVFLVVLALQNRGMFAGSALNGEGTRLSGLLIDPNAFGGLIVVALVIVVFLPRRLALFSRPTTVVVALILATGLLFTFSRSAWIGLGFALVATLLTQPWRSASVIVRSLPFVAAAGLVIAATASSNVSHLANRPETASGRLTIIEESIADLMTSPVVGIGLHGAPALHGRIVHNTLLWFVTEFGLFGLVAVSGLLGSYVVRALVARRELPPAHKAMPLALLAAFAGMIGVSMGIEAFYQRHWWVVMAGITACYAWGLSRHAGPADPVRRRPARHNVAGVRLRPSAPPAPPARPVTPASDRPAAARPTPVRRSTAMRASLRRDAVRDGFWGLTDQAISSGTNFLVTVVAASSVGAEEFGAFSFVTVLYILALGGWRALNAEPFMIRYAARPEQLPGPARRSLGATFLFGTTAGVACVVAAAWAPTPYQAPLLVLGAILPFLLLQDSARVMSFTMFRMRAAAANDGIWAGLLVLALGGLALVEPSAPVWVYLAAWGVTGAVAGLLLLRHLRLGLDLRVASPDMRENFRLGLPLFANYLLTGAPAYLLFLITPAVAGLAELGLLRAAYVPYGLFGVLLQGMQLVALPYAVRMPTPSAVVHLAWRLSIGLAGVAALWGVLVTVLLPAGIGRWLIGDLWEPTQTTRVLFAFAVVADALITGPMLALRALRAPGRLVRVRLVSGPTTLVLGLVLLPVLGADGVALASIAGSAMTLVLAVIEVRRTVAHGTPEPGPETAGLLPGSLT